jgi:urease accessory protein
MPETTIPFENSIFFSQSKIRLHSSSCLLFSEIFSSGRQKSEESFEFQRFSSKTQLYVDDKLIVYDHLDVKQDSAWAQLGMFEECTYMGVIWYVDPAWATSNYEELTKSFQQGRHHRFGYSNLDDYGVHFRWLSNDLCLLKEQMLAIMEGLGQVPRPS